MLSSSVGQSVDPDSVTMVDSIVVYSKTKETFNWYDEQAEEFASTPTTTPALTSASSGPSADSEPMSPPPVPMTSLDKILSSSLEVLDGVVNLVPQQDVSKITISQNIAYKQEAFLIFQ